MRPPRPPSARGPWLLCALIAGCTAELAGSGTAEPGEEPPAGDAGSADAQPLSDAAEAILPDQDATSGVDAAIEGGLSMDAATDSDASDAQDGGGHDAGPLDAGLVDASPPDARTPDAGCTRGPVDIVWALDGSTSMLGEIAQFAAQIVPLLERLRTAGADPQLTVFAPFDPLDFADTAPGPGYRHVSADAQNENLLAVLLNLVPTLRDELRPGVRTDVLVASDGDANLEPPAFAGQLQSTLGHPFTFHALAAPSSLLGVCSSAEKAGVRYERLTRDTGGAFLSICTTDWPATFMQLGDAVLADAPLVCH